MWAVVWLAVMVVKMAGDKVCCCILLPQLELYFFPYYIGVGECFILLSGLPNSNNNHTHTI